MAEPNSPLLSPFQAVANFLSSTGITDIRVLQAAILHDTVEDTHTSIGASVRPSRFPTRGVISVAALHPARRPPAGAGADSRRGDRRHVRYGCRADSRGA
jgi:hypothetical protein